MRLADWKNAQAPLCSSIFMMSRADLPDLPADTPDSSAPEIGEPEPPGVVIEDAAIEANAETKIEVDEPVRALEGWPIETFEALLKILPARELWAWLNEDEQFGLLHAITRGFQRTPNALKQNAVRKRFASHLQKHPGEAAPLLALWAKSEPAVLPQLRALDETTLHDALPALIRSHGADATLFALAREERITPEIRETWPQLVARANELPQIADADTNTSAPEPAATPSLSGGTSPANNELETLHARAVAAENALQVAITAQRETERERARTIEKSKGLQSALNAAKVEIAQAEQKAALELRQERGKNEAARLALQTNLEETRRRAERDGRKLKVAERERDELGVELKRTKRQLRQGQTLSEELRRQLSAVQEQLRASQARADALQAQREKRSKAWRSPQLSRLPEKVPLVPPPVPASPFDVPFAWQADGRAFRVTAREIKRAIDTNDEAFINNIVQGTDVLRALDSTLYGALMKRLRDLNPFYARVLKATTTRVLIDASNVARQEKNARGKGQIKHLLGMRDELRRRDCFPILIYADASLPYNLDEPDELLGMVKRGEIIMADAGIEADELLAREARRTGAYVVTNDRNFYLKVSPDYEPPRITFRVHDGVLIVDEF